MLPVAMLLWAKEAEEQASVTRAWPLGYSVGDLINYDGIHEEKENATVHRTLFPSSHSRFHYVKAKFLGRIMHEACPYLPPNQIG